MTFLYVALGAAVGAPLRYLINLAVQARHDSVFPWGTFIANLAGSLLLGFLSGALLAGAIPTAVGTAIGTGFCGTLTTYSTFAHETVRLYEDGSVLYVVANITASLFAGLGAAFVGWGLAHALWT